MKNNSNKTKSKKHQILERFVIALLILGVIIGGIFAYVTKNPQIIVGFIQSQLYKDSPINSFEPFNEPDSNIREDGSLYVNDIKYGDEYANSYLDITYPSEDISVDRPTIIYFHGGGYFGGDKSMGDPLAVDDDINVLFNEIVKNGYNFVNVNYALVPDYHFPVPLIQMNQAINFLVENAEKYGLNMDNVVIFGQSAGAILATQYGALISNEDYRNELNIYPQLTTEEVKALIIDDAPLATEGFNFNTKMLIRNYLDTSDLSGDIAKQYNALLHINENFPVSFMTAGNTDGFPEDMQQLADKLDEYNIDNEYYYRDRSYSDLPHGYLNGIKDNEYARECFDNILEFIDKYTK